MNNNQDYLRIFLLSLTKKLKSLRLHAKAMKNTTSDIQAYNKQIFPFELQRPGANPTGCVDEDEGYYYTPRGSCLTSKAYININRI